MQTDQPARDSATIAHKPCSGGGQLRRLDWHSAALECKLRALQLTHVQTPGNFTDLPLPAMRFWLPAHVELPGTAMPGPVESIASKDQAPCNATAAARDCTWQQLKADQAPTPVPWVPMPSPGASVGPRMRLVRLLVLGLPSSTGSTSLLPSWARQQSLLLSIAGLLLLGLLLCS